MTDERAAWERQPREAPQAYECFRAFRDLGPGRDVSIIIERSDQPAQRVRRWHQRHHWRDRARAWDEQCYRTEDAARLEALREMHRTHQAAGKLALAKAIGALQVIDPANIPATAAARLLELGTKLERSMLTTSLAALQGIDLEDGPTPDDPWDLIAADLQGAGVVDK